MPDDGAVPAGYFSSDDQERSPLQVRCTFRAVAYLLGGWYAWVRRGERPDGASMSSIEFDKLVTLFGRVWDSAWAIEGERTRELAEHPHLKLELDAAVTFRVPFEETPGKHGPGLAWCDADAKPMFFVELADKLSGLDVLPFFDFEKPKGSKYGASDGRTRVRLAKECRDLLALVSSFTGRERAILAQLEVALRRLSGDEIRALGTHSTRERSLSYIRREYHYLLPRLDETISDVRAGRGPALPAVSCWEFVEEAYRKSVSNRECYATGLGKIRAEITDKGVEKILDDAIVAPSALWQGEDMARLAELARRGTCLLGALSAGALADDSLEDTPDWLDDRRAFAQRRWAEVVDELPREIGLQFLDASEFQASMRSGAGDVRRRVLEALGNYRTRAKEEADAR